ncbi:hypothetical protein CL617_00370 [archaeon]|nr:hypothetical protein [archaeon]|tara:strand:+ start:3708 stop:4073 length:366 start_codon:yes stop_codon:yes gene_type:complete
MNKRGIKGLIFNLIIPGTGTIFLKNKKHGQIQLSLFLLPVIVSIIFGSVLNATVTTSAVLPIIFSTIMLSSWIWALTASVKFLRANQPSVLQDTQEPQKQESNSKSEQEEIKNLEEKGKFY